MVRIALTTAIVMAAGLFAATPAQAATAQVTVTSAYAVSANDLQVYGTVTCTQPTGVAHIDIAATQTFPFSHGWTSLDVPCASGAVFWGTTVYSGFGWQSNHPVTVDAAMTDGHGGSDDFSGLWQA